MPRLEGCMGDGSRMRLIVPRMPGIRTPSRMPFKPDHSRFRAFISAKRSNRLWMIIEWECDGLPLIDMSNSIHDDLHHDNRLVIIQIPWIDCYQQRRAKGVHVDSSIHKVLSRSSMKPPHNSPRETNNNQEITAIGESSGFIIHL